ncbi:MAG: radical SAM protein, partial [Calditrichia bacterium]|nr:radical SAM protein [Calditrichia bacterium]
FSIPFPGNFLSALSLAKNYKQKFPNGKVVFGGGYVNTELRKIKDKRIFNYTDFITLDNGEMPFVQILRNLESKNRSKKWVRTFTLEDKNVLYKNDYSGQVIPHNQLPAPDLTGINPRDYFSITEMLNPMHRLWSDGFWHKITAAHGCYWNKCSFCDTSLDYIKRYDPAKAKTIVDWMENLIKQSGISSFHFTDEAAPPAILKEMAIEILRRNLTVSWWGNIRFDKTFTTDACRLLAKSGCIAVSGGIEVADIRVLKLVNKGITLEQVIDVCGNFKNTGIMVHSYMMYGFPSQTEVETINSLEYVRQFFQHQLIDSAFWHLFTLTIHSPVCKNPEDFGTEITSPQNNPFANNDLRHSDKKGAEHHKFSAGLNKALYNYMHGIGLDWDVKEWFDFKVPSPKVNSDFVNNHLENRIDDLEPPDETHSIWAGIEPILENGNKNSILRIVTADMEAQWEVSPKTGKWLEKMLVLSSVKNGKFPAFAEWKSTFPLGEKEMDKFFKSSTWQELREVGLLFVK